MKTWISMQASDINMVIFWVCVAIGTVVYAIIIWSLVAYRKSSKQEAAFHKNTATEIAWTVIPLLLIIAMTIPAAKVLTRIYNGESGAGEALQETRQVGMATQTTISPVTTALNIALKTDTIG